MRREKGFTLIELMIIVAIIGILAAVIIPACSTYAESQDPQSITHEGDCK